MFKDSNFKKKIKLISQYFLHSDERAIAWLLLISAIVCVGAGVGMLALLAWWSVGFWAAIMAMNFAAFKSSLLIFSLILGGLIGVASLKNYLVEKLTIRWRTWLTQKLANKYISDAKKYLKLSRLSPDIDNPAQRIEGDVHTFVSHSISLGLGLLDSVITLVTFVSALWFIGGALSFVLVGINIVIPGYLVWIALIFAVVSTIITRKLGGPLTKLNSNLSTFKADYRQAVQNVHDKAESVAQEGAEPYYINLLKSKLKKLTDNANKMLVVNTKLTAFKSFCSYLPTILPYLACAPLYFAGKMAFGHLNQVSMSFGAVNGALGWFMDSYEDIAKYNASLNRLIELKKALKTNSAAIQQLITVKKSEDCDAIKIEKLNIIFPTAAKESRPIVQNLNLIFQKGEHILIKAPSGLGKSTLFKVIGGNWVYGSGTVTVPASNTMCFLPQTPVIPNDTLRGILAYPKQTDAYSSKDYERVLRAVGGDKSDFFIENLDDQSRQCPRQLSLGQQQRISFARALLQKPDWLFLDEATASLDSEAEQELYRVIKNSLPNTTLISIAHRDTVTRFHNTVVKLSLSADSSDIKVEKTSVLSTVLASVLRLAPQVRRGMKVDAGVEMPRVRKRTASCSI